MNWMIVSDSSCNIYHVWDLPEHVAYSTVAMRILGGSTEFTDTADLDTAAMMKYLDEYKGSSTSACPGPQEWLDQYEKADQVIAVTISSNLSGSYNSAVTAANMVLEDHPEKKIHVVDSLSTGGEMALIIHEVIRAIREGADFEGVVSRAEAVKDRSNLLFVLCSFENLVKNGRMSRIAGFVAGRLGLRAIGRASEEGTVDIFAKSRGEVHAMASIVEELENAGFTGGPVYLDHVLNEKAALLLSVGIRKKWPRAKIIIGKCGGLCSFYAQRNGFMLGFLSHHEQINA